MDTDKVRTKIIALTNRTKSPVTERDKHRAYLLKQMESKDPSTRLSAALAWNKYYSGLWDFPQKG